MTISDYDKEKLLSDYKTRYSAYGYSPKTLGWDKGKQDIRFSILLGQSNIAEKRILDIGCGFGDVNKYLRSQGITSYQYTGIDIVDDLIHEAKEKNSTNGEAKISYICGDFLQEKFDGLFDYIISSGIFNRKFKGEMDNYSYIERCIEKAFSLCSEDGVIAFDFLSDKVDYQYEHTFHSSPERILSYAYSKSRNVILRNDYMPFEFAVFIFKNDSFSKTDTVFTRYWEVARNNMSRLTKV